MLGLAYTRGDLSSDFEDLMESDGIKPSSHEDAWELAYRVQLTGWLVVQPMVQWVSNPGADSAVDDATIVGARVEITF